LRPTRIRDKEMLQFGSLNRAMESDTISKNGRSLKSHTSKGNVRLMICISLLSLILFSGCSNRILDFTIVSTKNVDMSKASSFRRASHRVKGKDMAHWIIIFPTGSVSIKEAVDKAIESTPGCVALLDGVIYTKFWWIPYIYGQQSAIVQGTPLIDTSITADQTNGIPTFGKIELDKRGEIKSVEIISVEDFVALRSKIVKDGQKIEFYNSSEI